jgi:hypothetical protein
MLKISERRYLEVKADNLNDYLSSIYGRRFNLYENEGVGYNTILMFDVSDRQTRFEIADVANFRGGQLVPNVTRALLVHLCELGHIQPGRYIVVSAS